MPPKMYFLFYLQTQILPIDSYVLNSKSAAFQSIWLKFGQSDAIYLFYKTVSANFNTPFHSVFWWNVLRSECGVNCFLPFISSGSGTEWTMIYRDVHFYTKRSNFETHLSKSFLLVQIHNPKLLSF